MYCYTNTVEIDRYIRKTYAVEVRIDPKSGGVSEELWKDEHGNFSRPGDLPAVIDYNPDTGFARYMRWYNEEGKAHRSGNLPSTIAISEETGAIVAETYQKRGLFVRDGGLPAHIERTPEGVVILQRYMKGSQLHRVDGPAVEHFDPTNGELINDEYWLNGEIQAHPNDAAAPPPEPL